MKILLVVPQNIIPPDNGGKISIYRPMKILAEIYQVKALVFCDKGEKFNKNDYSCINVDALSVAINKKDSILSALLNVGSVLPFKFSKYYSKKHKKFLELFCHEWQPEVIICHHSHLASYFEKLKVKLPGTKLILREHNVEYLLVKQYYEQQKNMLLKAFAYWQFAKTKRFEERCWAYFDKVAFISDGDFSYFKKEGSRANGLVIYDGTQLLTGDNFPAQSKTKSFLFTGSLTSFQNKFNLFQFVHTIWIPWKKQFSDASVFELWITGDKEKAFAERALALGPDDERRFKIKILGFVDNLGALLKSCFFFLSPTLLGAGLRIKVIEAMGAGCVVFMTQKDFDMARPMKSGLNAVVYTDVYSFNEQCKTLSQDIGLYNTISINAARTAQDNFTWEVFSKRIQQLIESVA